MADRDGDSAYWSKIQREEVPHCGLCDPVGRLIENDDGSVSRCPRCHPLALDLLPQHWRCPRCHVVIVRDDRELPCGKHRPADAARRVQAEARKALPPVNPVTQAGAEAARARLAERHAEPGPMNQGPQLEPGRHAPPGYDDEYDDEIPF